MESNKSLYFKLVAVVLLIGLMFGLKAYQDAGKAKKTKEVTALKKAKEYVAEETKLYLKLKHNEEFGVSSVRYIPETEGYEIMVYPVKNPTVEFMVTKSRATGFQLNGSYKNELRYLESIKIMEPFAKKISDKYLLSAWFNGDILDEKEYWNMEIPLKEVIKKYHNKTYLGMRIFYFIDIKESNKKEIQQKIYEIVKHLESLKLENYEISIEFYDEAYFRDKDVVKIEKEKMGPSGMANFTSQYINYIQYQIRISTKPLNPFVIDSETIKSYRDIQFEEVVAYDDTSPHQRPEVREYRESKKEARKEERKRKWKNFKIKGGQ